MIFKKIAYLKTKQDQKSSNFGMIGMGYVVEVLNEYEEEIKKRDKLLADSLIYLNHFASLMDFVSGKNKEWGSRETFGIKNKIEQWLKEYGELK